MYHRSKISCRREVRASFDFGQHIGQLSKPNPAEEFIASVLLSVVDYWDKIVARISIIRKVREKGSKK